METLLPKQRGQRGPLLRAIWQVGRSTFLLGTLSLIISDVFRFTVPKLLRWVQALGALLRLVVPEQCPSRPGRPSTLLPPLPGRLLLKALRVDEKGAEEEQK